MLSARNVEQGRIVFEEFRYINEDSFVAEDARTRIAPDDVLLTIVGTIGRSAVVPHGVERFALQRSVAVLTPKPDLLSKFLNYQLQSPRIQRHFEANARGTAQKGVYLKTLGETPIQVPAIDDQRAVVAELEKQFSRLDEAVAGLQRVKANLKRYKAAVLKSAVTGRLVPTEADLARRDGRGYETGAELLQRILETRRSQWQGKGKYKEPAAPDTAGLPELPEGWAWTLSDVLFDFVTSGSRGWATYYSDSGAKFIRVGNLDHNTIDLDLREIQHVQPPVGPEADRSRVRPGDLLISITAELGMVAVAPESLGEAYINQHVAIARSTTEVCREYLGWYFACADAGKQQLESLRRGATKAGLGLDDIRAVWVATPPQAEQHRIVAEVDRLLSIAREAEAEVNTNLNRAQGLRQSVLAKSFAG